MKISEKLGVGKSRRQDAAKSGSMEDMLSDLEAASLQVSINDVA